MAKTLFQKFMHILYKYLNSTSTLTQYKILIMYALNERRNKRNQKINVYLRVNNKQFYVSNWRYINF